MRKQKVSGAWPKLRHYARVFATTAWFSNDEQTKKGKEGKLRAAREQTIKTE